MPLREFACPTCGSYNEIYHHSIDPDLVPRPLCQDCGQSMKLLLSVPLMDTSDSFHPFDYTGPDGAQHRIDNLHKLRAVEHSYLATGHDVRFDAYSADPSNPDATDGFGLEHWDGNKNHRSSTRAYNFAEY